MEAEVDFTGRLVVLQDLLLLHAGAVWPEFCDRQNNSEIMSGWMSCWNTNPAN
jgi:L-rhamnose isomerase